MAQTIPQLEAEIKERQDKIEQIREACSHPPVCVDSEYWQATDEYGTDVTAQGYSNECSLCGKRWGTEKEWK